MQNIIFYVDAHETLGAVRDYANAKSAAAPTLVRGVEACLKIRLFASVSGPEPYPAAAFENVVSWQWAMDNDFNEATVYKLVGDNENITVGSVAENIDDEERSFTEISVPMTKMNTEELAAWLGTDKSRSGLAGELVGFDAEGRQVYILQIENFTVRNRISSLGNPTGLTPDYLTAAQVRALFSAGMECQFSPDGENWHEVQTVSDNYVRMRLRGEESGRWSDPVILMTGPRGYPGKDAFVYAAYASDATGKNFSLEPSESLKFRAEIHTDTEIATPAAEDFAGAKWIKYIGDDGSGVGDMLKSVYDPEESGTVLAAKSALHAAAAGTVPWSGISGRPEVYKPSEHVHGMEQITNPVCQSVYSVSNPKTLFLNYPVVRNTSGNGSGTIELDFTAIQSKPGGESRYPAANEMWTWEYHVLCTADVTGVSIGSEKCSMGAINIPETLKQINGNATVHVFVIRAVYKSGTVNNTRFQANYAYSYEA